MKNIFNILKFQKGFSLTELVIVVGVMGVVSIGVMEMNNNQQKMQNFSKTKDSEVSLVRLSRLSLLTQKACQLTFGNGVTTVPGNIASIKDEYNRDVIQTGSEIGDNTNKIVVDSIGVRPYDATVVPTEGDNLIYLDLRTTRMLQGSPDKELTQSFLMRVELNAFNQIVRCNTSVGAVSDNLAEEFCESTDGTWDDVNLICVRPTISADCPPYPGGAGTELLTAGCLTVFEDEVLDPDYINLSGDTIEAKLDLGTNDLTIQGETRINSGGEFCVGGSCRDFSQSTCSNQSVVTGIQADGTFSASECRALTCSGAEYVRGIDSSGFPICLPIRSGVCGAGDVYVTEVLPNGTVNCAPLPSLTPTVGASSGQYIEDISADGTVNRRSDNYLSNFSCTEAGAFINGASGGNPTCVKPSDTNVFAQVCDPGYAATGYNSSGVISCELVNCTSSWTPATSTVCSGETFTQSDGCGYYRDETGTKNCATCTPSWQPAASGVCSGESFTQTDGCGNSQTATGTQDCTPPRKVWKYLYCYGSPCVEDKWYNATVGCPFPSNTDAYGTPCDGSMNRCEQNIGSSNFYVREYFCSPE